MIEPELIKYSMFSESELEIFANEEQICLQQYHAGNPIPLRKFWDVKRADFQVRSANRNVK